LTNAAIVFLGVQMYMQLFILQNFIIQIVKLHRYYHEHTLLLPSQKPFKQLKFKLFS